MEGKPMRLSDIVAAALGLVRPKPEPRPRLPGPYAWHKYEDPAPPEPRHLHHMQAMRDAWREGPAPAPLEIDRVRRHLYDGLGEMRQFRPVSPWFSLRPVPRYTGQPSPGSAVRYNPGQHRDQWQAYEGMDWAAGYPHAAASRGARGMPLAAWQAVYAGAGWRVRLGNAEPLNYTLRSRVAADKYADSLNARDMRGPYAVPSLPYGSVGTPEWLAAAAAVAPCTCGGNDGAAGHHSSCVRSSESVGQYGSVRQETHDVHATEPRYMLRWSMDMARWVVADTWVLKGPNKIVGNYAHKRGAVAAAKRLNARHAAGFAAIPGMTDVTVETLAGPTYRPAITNPKVVIEPKPRYVARWAPALGQWAVDDTHAPPGMRAVESHGHMRDAIAAAKRLNGAAR